MKRWLGFLQSDAGSAVPLLAAAGPSATDIAFAAAIVGVLGPRACRRRCACSC